MSSYVSGNLTSTDDSRSRLSALVRDFDREANACRNRMRELVEADRESFFTGAIEVLKHHDDSRGRQHIVGLMVAYDLLVRALCNPELDRDRALELARAATRVDPMTDVLLARRLADSAGSSGSPLEPDDAGRLMEILAEISDGPRILPSLMRLLRHPNPYVRSKAVKLVGRGGGSVKWVRSRLAESDSRIRANAVEALWGVDNDEARELFQTAAHDGNNRVAGNALIALYRLGDPSAIPELLAMADHGSALFRTTAAWAMGETGDPRFTETLARLLREPNAAVRTRAMSSLGRIKAAVARSRQGPRCLATGLWLDCDPQKSTRRLQLAITSEDGVQHHKILPTQLLLSEDGKHVTTYKVTERPSAEAMSVVFGFPRSGIPGSSPWTLAALQCRAWKRTSDLWAVQTYLTDAPPDPESRAAAAPEGPRYSANLESITAALSAPPMRSVCEELWKSIWLTATAEHAPARGRRHLILFCDHAPDLAPGKGLISAVLASRMTVQIVSTGPNPRVEKFCHAVHGTFQVAETDEDIVRAITLAYLNLLARYEITYQPVCAAAPALKIRINQPEGWAETSLPVPTQPSA